ncbi:MAG: hypothetical protein ABIW49_11695 [Knoellia sp.]
MTPSPAFREALREERDAARELLRVPSSADLHAVALGRLADLDDIEARAVDRPAMAP